MHQCSSTEASWVWTKNILDKFCNQFDKVLIVFRPKHKEAFKMFFSVSTWIVRYSQYKVQYYYYCHNYPPAILVDYFTAAICGNLLHYLLPEQ